MSRLGPRALAELEAGPDAWRLPSDGDLAHDQLLDRHHYPPRPRRTAALQALIDTDPWAPTAGGTP